MIICNGLFKVTCENRHYRKYHIDPYVNNKSLIRSNGRDAVPITPYTRGIQKMKSQKFIEHLRQETGLSYIDVICKRKHKHSYILSQFKPDVKPFYGNTSGFSLKMFKFAPDRKNKRIVCLTLRHRAYKKNLIIDENFPDSGPKKNIVFRNLSS
jgi:hypothetical protein